MSKCLADHGSPKGVGDNLVQNKSVKYLDLFFKLIFKIHATKNYENIFKMN